MEKIRVGTMVSASEAEWYIPQIHPYGFECYSLSFGDNAVAYDLKETAKKVKDVMAQTDAVISSLAIFCNPLGKEEDIKHWEALIDAAPLFGTDIVGGFAGRVPNLSIGDNMPKFKEVFTPLAKRAADLGVKLAFENCDMDGTWLYGDYNIAHNPSAWEMMFNELPMDNVGLEWEPAHQIVSLIDPLTQLKKWVNKVIHVHGKDCTLDWNIIREYGVHGPKDHYYHRTPGYGDTNWVDVFAILRQGGYKGTIDIEGWHDPVYRGELEMTGQVHGLNYLKNCRCDNIPNPKPPMK